MVKELQLKKKENPIYIYIYQVWKPIYQKYKANVNTSRHNPKKKQEQTIYKSKVKTLRK